MALGSRWRTSTAAGHKQCSGSRAAASRPLRLRKAVYGLVNAPEAWWVLGDGGKLFDTVTKMDLEVKRRWLAKPLGDGIEKGTKVRVGRPREGPSAGFISEFR